MLLFWASEDISGVKQCDDVYCLWEIKDIFQDNIFFCFYFNFFHSGHGVLMA